MSTPNITRWIGKGLLGLPLYGVMTFFSSIDPQPDPNTHYEAWAGVSTFSAPFEGQIVLAGMEEEIDELPIILANTLQGATMVVSIVLAFVGNVLLGVAVWRSGILPKWAGALWAFAPVLMYIFGLVYAMTIGAQATPPMVPAGAVVLTISGAWIAWSVLSRPDAAQVVVGAQPRVQ